jgi:hypothetical protein
MGFSGRLYVTDTGNNRIIVMAPSGEWLDEIEGDQDSGFVLDAPVGVAAVEAEDPWISSKQDFLVVADRGGTRLTRLTLDGRVTAGTDADAIPEPEAHFDYLAIDYYGNVYATDRSNDRIRKFDRDLQFVTGIGHHGTGDMELDEPRGITLYRRFGQIFITERAGAQYFWIGTDIQNARVDPSEIGPGVGQALVHYYLTETARVDLNVYDSSGKLVATPVKNRRRAIGENTERWKGTVGPEATPLPPGEYTLRLIARPTYSAGEYFHDTAEVRILLH